MNKIKFAILLSLALAASRADANEKQFEDFKATWEQFKEQCLSVFEDLDQFVGKNKTSKLWRQETSEDGLITFIHFGDEGKVSKATPNYTPFRLEISTYQFDEHLSINCGKAFEKSNIVAKELSSKATEWLRKTLGLTVIGGHVDLYDSNAHHYRILNAFPGEEFHTQMSIHNFGIQLYAEKKIVK